MQRSLRCRPKELITIYASSRMRLFFFAIAIMLMAMQIICNTDWCADPALAVQLLLFVKLGRRSAIYEDEGDGVVAFI